MIQSSKLVYKALPGLAANVRVIEQNASKRMPLIHVAAYCRVSTKIEEQKRSLENQMAVFNKTISEHPRWVLAGIYADSGISGTSVRQRTEFLRMIEDAKAGKIQYILVKSISRFSRNTVDALQYVRELKRYGVSVFFENEQIDTRTVTSELLISILAANAQEQILSLSNNMKVGIRMRYAAGRVSWTPLYGYRKGADDAWEICEEEATIIRRIFKEYLAGDSLAQIARGLEKDKIPSVNNSLHWYPNRISAILHNERYIGDVRMQKSYISDPIEHKRQDNRDARIKQYYMTDHHPAIIDRASFQMAGAMSAMRDLHRGLVQYPFYGILKCPLCGQNMVRFSLPKSNYRYAWTCGGKPSRSTIERSKRSKCPPNFVLENYVTAAFEKALFRFYDEDLCTMQKEGKESADLAEKLTICKQIVAQGKHVEYPLLFETVQQITFPQWTVMAINWANGEVSEIGIRYRSPGDEPLPSVMEEAPPCTLPTVSFTEDDLIVQRAKTGSIPWQRQFSAAARNRREVQALRIREPKSYEVQIPMVFGSGTISLNNRRKQTKTNYMLQGQRRPRTKLDIKGFGEEEKRENP
ncbi:MAG: recombinase family protein [Clostridia bacterium]|nr:recombinase family protein [Clostridia bacterium]